MSTWGPPWLVRALGEVGVRELSGARSNPAIEAYHAHTAAGAAPDDVSWCSSFLCAMMERSGFASTNSKAAASWLRYGDPSEMRLGAVAVFGKADPDAMGTGHVALVVGWDALRVLVLGGNQNQSVCVALRARDRILDIRWPSGYVWP